MDPKRLSDHPAVKAYLQARAALAGSVTSPKKAKTARANGKKGGRPRGPNYKPRKR